MVQISFSKREILVKIVYYGMGLCGKTTSLQYLHSIMDDSNTTKLFSVKTDEDRTLFFDFLPVTVSTFNNFKIKLKIYTVPGQVKYSATRKAVLAGVDGVVFVIDSQENLLDDNVESFRDLLKNLDYYGLKAEDVPIVFQYNKRDLNNLTPVQDLNGKFNRDKSRAFFPTIATRGDGIADAFLEVSKLVMENVISKHKLPVGDDIIDSFLLSLRVPMQQNEANRGTESESESSREDDTVNIMVGSTTEDETELLQHAVTSNIEMADLYDELEELKRSLESRVRELITANQISATVVAELDTDRVIQIASDALQRHGEFGVSMLLEGTESGDLRETLHSNIKEDPLNNIILESGLTAAHAIMQRNRVVLLNRHKNTQIFAKVQGEVPEVASVISIPLSGKKKPLGILNLYSYDREDFPKDTLSFYHLIANNIAIALENARLYNMVNHLNRELKEKMEEIHSHNEILEDTVRTRTRELRDSNLQLEKVVDELRTLDKLKDDFMGLMSHELRTPLTSIITYTQSMLEGMVTEEAEQKQFLGVIFQESSHLSQIIERVIDAVNFENERGYVHLETTHLPPIVHHVLERHGSEIANNGISISGEPQRLDIKADPVRAEQVVDFVLDNAVRHTPAGGTITISTAESEDTVSLFIQDSGPGIPDDMAEIIFDRFKLMGDIEHHSRGMRLGLHLSNHLMKAMDGSISLENPGEKGACFRIDFQKP